MAPSHEQVRAQREAAGAKRHELLEGTKARLAALMTTKAVNDAEVAQLQVR